MRNEENTEIIVNIIISVVGIITLKWMFNEMVHLILKAGLIVGEYLEKH